MWRDTIAGAALGPAQRVLLEEACRIADRLDKLEAILSGSDEGWMRFRTNDDGSEVTVTLDRALAESRAQAVALKQIVAEIRQSAAGGKPATKEGSALDQLAARRAARLANTAG